MSAIHVAVAVIYYAEEYLLAFRHAKQHQGNRYEFIGGKIEADETPLVALIREVKEEIDVDISDTCIINQMGILRHKYDDIGAVNSSKEVCLHVYRVQLSSEQYSHNSGRQIGCEGQRLIWVSKFDLLAEKYLLPEANKTIIQWLQLSDMISITKELIIHQKEGELTIKMPSQANKSQKDIDTASQQQSWLAYYSKYLPLNSSVYVRLKQVSDEIKINLIEALLSTRQDIKLIVDSQLLAQSYQQHFLASPQIMAQHVTESVLNDIVSDTYEIEQIKVHNLPALPMTISCHSEMSIKKANELAQYQLNRGNFSVIAIFISPIKQTATHPDKEALGWHNFKKLAMISEVPVIALGGLAPKDLLTVRKYGGDKVAGISQFLTLSM